MVLLKMTQTWILNYFWGWEGSLHVCLYVNIYIFIYTHLHKRFLYLGIEVQKLLQWMFLKHKTEDFKFGLRSEVASF